MNFIEFRKKMFNLACFNVNQIYAWQPDFNRNNLVRWTSQGLLIRLRQGYYTFPEYKEIPGYSYYFANRIYRPSYISLHTALSFYDIIPEAVTQITSITSMKTASFTNSFGDYVYRTVKEELMFGYDLKSVADDLTVAIATPEKALTDLLYLYPFYNSEKELQELRLDEDYLHEKMDKHLLNEFVLRFKNRALEKRIGILIKTYAL